MALTLEQQAQIDMQVATQIATEAPRNRLEAVRLAKDVLIENARSKPVDSRDVSASDITAFASNLMAYINNG